MQQTIKRGILLLILLAGGILYASSVDNTIIKKLTQYGNAKKYGFNNNDKLIHTILYSYDFEYQGKKSKLIIASTDSVNNSHSHVEAPKLSLFIERNNKLVLSHINAFFAGQWGEAPSKDAFKVVKLGKDKFGFTLKGFESGQGWIGEYISFYFPINGRFENIIGIEKSSNNEASESKNVTDWDSTIRYEKSNSSLYDIIIHSKGIKSNKKINRTQRYRFDGKKYVKTQNITSKSNNTPKKSLTKYRGQVMLMLPLSSNNDYHILQFLPIKHSQHYIFLK